ncbi:hypothetical protein ATANTOWER_004797 [Ataeniobius toweri]|uniref:F5/8 type C domain-containing protein n=1 Tax=Ataeniobius toweri TaxID=208326 RepID=A0ABU7CER1_9TELE|nr:hypothetical protein [Ataeniobius toweri]
MRAEVLVVWVGLSLCWALVSTGEPVEKQQLSRVQAHVREARGLLRPGREGDREDAEMSDEPAEVTVEEKTKAKKKKTPEEIEAARAKKAAEKEAKAKKQKGPKPTKKPKPPKPTKKPKPPKPTKKPKAPKPTKKPKTTLTTVQPEIRQPPLEEEVDLDTSIQLEIPTEPVEPDLVIGGYKDNKKEATTTEVIMYIPEETTSVPFIGPWYDEYDYTDLAVAMAKKQQEEEERARKEKAEKAERLRKQWEEEEAERLKQTSFPADPKKCPPLGLESHRVEDDQLLASSQSHHGFAAQRGRLNMQSSEDEEDMYGGAWCAESEEKEHWFQVDARREVEFTAVITQGRNSEQL